MFSDGAMCAMLYYGSTCMIKLQNITTNTLTPHCAASKRLLEVLVPGELF